MFILIFKFIKKFHKICTKYGEEIFQNKDVYSGKYMALLISLKFREENLSKFLINPPSDVSALMVIKGSALCKLLLNN